MQQTVMTSDPPRETRTSRSVLVVDDSRLQRRILSAMLKDGGLMLSKPQQGQRRLICAKNPAPNSYSAIG